MMSQKIKIFIYVLLSLASSLSFSGQMIYGPVPIQGQSQNLLEGSNALDEKSPTEEPTIIRDQIKNLETFGTYELTAQRVFTNLSAAANKLHFNFITWGQFLLEESIIIAQYTFASTVKELPVVFTPNLLYSTSKVLLPRTLSDSSYQKFKMLDTKNVKKISEILQEHPIATPHKNDEKGKKDQKEEAPFDVATEATITKENIYFESSNLDSKFVDSEGFKYEFNQSIFEPKLSIPGLSKEFGFAGISRNLVLIPAAGRWSRSLTGDPKALVAPTTFLNLPDRGGDERQLLLKDCEKLGTCDIALKNVKEQIITVRGMDLIPNFLEWQFASAAMNDTFVPIVFQPGKGNFEDIQAAIDELKEKVKADLQLDFSKDRILNKTINNQLKKYFVAAEKLGIKTFTLKADLFTLPFKIEKEENGVQFKETENVDKVGVGAGTIWNFAMSEGLTNWAEALGIEYITLSNIEQIADSRFAIDALDNNPMLDGMTLVVEDEDYAGGTPFWIPEQEKVAFFENFRAKDGQKGLFNTNISTVRIKSLKKTWKKMQDIASIMSFERKNVGKSKEIIAILPKYSALDITKLMNFGIYSVHPDYYLCFKNWLDFEKNGDKFYELIPKRLEFIFLQQQLAKSN